MNFRPTGTSLLALAALGIFCLQSFSIHQQSIMRSHIEHVLSLHAINMQTLTSTWVSGGVTHTVTTPYESPETGEEHVDRHDAKLQIALKRWPVDT